MYLDFFYNLETSKGYRTDGWQKLNEEKANVTFSYSFIGKKALFNFEMALSTLLYITVHRIQTGPAVTHSQNEAEDKY